jgi:predicted HTH transcriptional regulator
MTQIEATMVNSLVIPSIKFLQKIELIKDNKPTSPSLLLFGNNPRSYFPSAFLKLGRFCSPIQLNNGEAEQLE